MDCPAGGGTAPMTNGDRLKLVEWVNVAFACFVVPICGFLIWLKMVRCEVSPCLGSGKRGNMARPCAHGYGRETASLSDAVLSAVTDVEQTVGGRDSGRTMRVWAALGCRGVVSHARLRARECRTGIRVRGVRWWFAAANSSRQAFMSPYTSLRWRSRSSTTMPSSLSSE